MKIELTRQRTASPQPNLARPARWFELQSFRSVDLPNAFWLVSANHDAGSAAFREPPARWCADFSRGSRFQAMAFIANSGDRIRYPLGAVASCCRFPVARRSSSRRSPPSARCGAEVTAPAAQAARLRKRVYWGSNSSFTVPTGPLRCLVTMTSVMPRSGVSGL